MHIFCVLVSVHCYAINKLLSDTSYEWVRLNTWFQT